MDGARGEESVLILGAGVIGLTTAVKLLQAGFNVTIWTKALHPNITSSVAGGLVAPYLAEPADKVALWTRETIEHYQHLTKTDARCKEMFNPISYVEMYNEPSSPPSWKDVMPYRKARQEELAAQHKDGAVSEVLVVEVPLFMEYLLARVRELGGKVGIREVHDVKEAFDAGFSIVINCTGLGSRYLFNDKEVYPCRGQIVLAKRNKGADRLQNLVQIGDDFGPGSTAYVIPRAHEVVLGGTKQNYHWSTEVDKDDTKAILKNVALINKFYKPGDVEIVAVRVGLRPARAAIRVEIEPKNNGKQFVIHNYGHGGSGFTVAWGCANDVVQMARKCQHLTAQLRNDARASSRL